jgi:glucose/arabinose dehydrogenase
MSLGAATVDANGVKSYPVTSEFQGPAPTIVRVLEPTNPPPGTLRRFLYVLPVEAGVTNSGSLYSDGLEELRLLDVHNRYNLTLIAPSFHIEPWYGDHDNDPTRRLESFIVRDLVPFGDSFATPGVIPQRWVLGFSKSGAPGALGLILRHPNVFTAAAAWDAPAQFTNMSAFSGMAQNFGSELNFDRYEIPTLVIKNGEAFRTRNRIWISGDDSAWTSHMIQLHNQMTSAAVLHMWLAGGPRTHAWYSGWLEGAVAALNANASSDSYMDVNAQRIIAYGLRNPTRFAFRPGTSEIWIADTGLNDWQEINRVVSAIDGVVENFGSPCYANNTTTGYSGLGLCTELYAESAAARPPVYAYHRDQQVVAGESCAAGSGSISGIAFYGTGAYPTSYRDALFFSDVARNCIWVMPKGSNGLPDPTGRSTFMANAANPVDLRTGPAGDLFYADTGGGTVLRISYVGGPPDTTPPARSNGSPSGTLPGGTTQTTLIVLTNEDATCRYATTVGTPYGSMPSTFASTGGVTHTTTVSGLSSGASYSFFVRCQDSVGNINPDDYTISFSIAADTTAPVRSSGSPSGTLAAGTTQTTLSLATNESATCRFATTAGTAYASMPSTFTTTGGTTHSTTVSGLSNGGSYSYFVRCQDLAGNANTNDFTIGFSVALSGSGGLVAVYSFNEGTGTSAADASGNGHTGVISGAAWSTLGKYGNALSFDGVNDWVTVNATSLLNITGAITMEAWVFPIATTGVRDILIKEGSNVDIYNLYARNGNGRPESNVFVGGSNRVAQGTAALTVNVWTHVAGTYDGTTVRVFINGVQTASAAVSGPIATSTGVLRIGGNGLWGEFFQGRLDEIRIYNRALSQAEIQTDMNTPVAP